MKRAAASSVLWSVTRSLATQPSGFPAPEGTLSRQVTEGNGLCSRGQFCFNSNIVNSTLPAQKLLAAP